MNEDLQFDRAETPSQEAATCRQCQAPLRDHYFAVNGAMLCDTCVETVRQVASGVGTPVGRFSRATLLGAGAMLISAVAYSLWMGFTNTEFALVTIAMGWFVGKAVRRGSGDRGGWRYGLLAVVLTYCAIAFSFFGATLNEMKSKPAKAETAEARAIVKPTQTDAQATDPTSAIAASPASDQSDEDVANLRNLPPVLSTLLLLGVAFAMPVISATHSILSGLITVFGLWQAWSINRALKLQVTGPHLMGESPSAGA